MEGLFSVYLDGQAVGTVQVSREGLYYRFFARCQLSEHSVCRLVSNEVSLGILVPVENGFGLDTKMPAKRFQDPWHFEIVPNRPVLAGRFVPIRPEEPFAYLERLKYSYLVRRDGNMGILIQEKAGT